MKQRTPSHEAKPLTQAASVNPPVHPTSRDKVLLCARAALDKLAENVRILDLNEISGFTDYFVICSGRSTKQVQAISDSIREKMGSVNSRAVEGYSDGRWILMDLGEIVAHIFLDELRDYYDLEGLWASAKRVPVPAEFFVPG